MKSNGSIASNQELSERAEADDGATGGPLFSRQSAAAKPISSTKGFKGQTPSSSRTKLSITIERDGKSQQNSEAAAETGQATIEPNAADSGSKDSRESPLSSKSDSQDLTKSSQSSSSHRKRSGLHRSDSIKSGGRVKKKRKHREATNKVPADETDSKIRSACVVLMLMISLFLLFIFLLIFFEGKSFTLVRATLTRFSLAANSATRMRSPHQDVNSSLKTAITDFPVFS